VHLGIRSAALTLHLSTVLDDFSRYIVALAGHLIGGLVNTILLHAEEAQVRGFLIRCTKCESYNSMEGHGRLLSRQPRDTRRKITLRQRSTWDPCRGEVFTIGALSHFNGCRARQRKNVRLRSQSVHFYTDINPGAGESGRTELPLREASPHALRTHCEFSQAHRRPTRGDFARDTQHSSFPQRRMRNCEYSITSRAQQRSCREGRSTLSQSFQLYRAP
jgi:hypothetical protein